MDERLFVDICKRLVCNYVNENLDQTNNIKITEQDVFVVWLCKILQNNKALVSTTLPDGMYYEITLNGDTKEVYLDIYKKWQHSTIKLVEEQPNKEETNEKVEAAKETAEK